MNKYVRPPLHGEAFPMFHLVPFRRFPALVYAQPWSHLEAHEDAIVCYLEHAARAHEQVARLHHKTPVMGET